MQSIRGGRTSSQQCQFQELSQPQHSRTHKLYFQSPSCVRAPVPKNAPAYCARSGGGKSLATASSAMRTKAPIPKYRSRSENSWPSVQIKSSGRRPNAKAVVSAIPVARPRARITGIMEVPLFWLCGDCQGSARTSVIAITFWSFFESC